MNNPVIQIVDTVAAIADLVGLFNNLSNEPPSLYIDIEGINLCRQGSISIIQIFHLPRNEIYLIDVHTLGQSAFSTPSTNSGTTLKMVLEAGYIQKAFFDVRNDSDALYNIFGVHLAGIQDIQLLELATRNFSRRRVNGLARCIQHDASLTPTEIVEWRSIKDKGGRLFAPEKGGSYDIFNRRPLPEEIIQYCAQDVQILPKLYHTYNGRIGRWWREKVEVAVRERIDVCLQAGYTGKGSHKALAPAGWA
ncbi:hypothetical protein FE257_001728 [Aspergillus nanangensis]|uniref:3'-5' exonuclease domain-containing protein n=1 Tax=Aspergillus nanangensis TaxID=2582783 RepID=A0AAD4CDU7_ASPNN|nr:hypothetical protein FE257_001728 [Aspergillus nanangensis]